MTTCEDLIKTDQRLTEDRLPDFRQTERILLDRLFFPRVPITGFLTERKGSDWTRVGVRGLPLPLWMRSDYF